MQGIVEGRNVVERMTKLMAKYKQENQTGKVNFSERISSIREAEHNKLLDKYLKRFRHFGQTSLSRQNNIRLAPMGICRLESF